MHLGTSSDLTIGENMSQFRVVINIETNKKLSEEYRKRLDNMSADEWIQELDEMWSVLD